MADLGKIEYRIRPITRYAVTRYHQSAEGNTGGSEQKGEYDNQQIAYEVGYALAKEESRRLGLSPGDERVIFPKMAIEGGVDECRTVRGSIGGNAIPIDLS